MSAFQDVAMPSYPQGEPRFIGLLKQHTPFVPHWDETAQPGSNELNLKPGAVLRADFPDPEKLLETAYSDFDRFLAEAGLAGGSVPVFVKPCSGMESEEYCLTVEKDSVTLEASDTEGIRRALYYLRDLIAGAPYLKIGRTIRKPWLKNRISRCFFGPIKRPPFNIDELMNDIDYYPEEYLSRLAHEGVNGLWLTITFREICDSSIRKAIPEAEKRLAKLRRTVERCRRYGIRTWVFCIEPIYWSVAHGNPLPPGCEELLGPGWTLEQAGFDINSFCVNSETARKYLYECTNSLFRSVPHLGGLITISLGERVTSCLSRAGVFGNGTVPCSHPCGKTPSEILADVLGSMKRGMTDANPEAELISWLYIPYAEQPNHWIAQLPEKLPSDIVLAFNFESGVTRKQLDSVRAGGDYWLSEVGPSDRFVMMSQAARGHCQFAAKLQVACSHECATVPYIPAPELVYRKYRKMKELGIRHVIQCWYFGNYPGLMNEAAGKLAYEDFSAGEDAFLEALAKPEWGSKDAPRVVRAWKYFAEGYSQYPLDIQFQYFGPMHDGPVWPLHLKQAMLPLPQSWMPEPFPAGDAFGDAVKHFQLSELAELTGRLSDGWHKGFVEMQSLPRASHELDFTLAEALDIQFRSGHNILRFYTVRNALLDSPADAPVLLAGLKKIVREEIANSLWLAELCREDSRLGYHSEAEVYKYFPEKLQWRAAWLEHLLETDFPEAEKILNVGGDIGEFLRWQGETAVAGRVCGANGIRWSFESDCDSVTFHIDIESKGNNPEVIWLFFYDRKAEYRPLWRINYARKDSKPTPTGWHVDHKISRLELHQDSVFFFGVEKQEILPDGRMVSTNDREGEFRHNLRLNLGYAGADKVRRVVL